MPNEHVIIVGMALLLFWVAFGGRAGVVAGVLSAIMIVGALRHPEIATGGRQLVGTQEEQLQAVMILVGLILFPRLAWWWLKGGRR